MTRTPNGSKSSNFSRRALLRTSGLLSSSLLSPVSLYGRGTGGIQNPKRADYSQQNVQISLDSNIVETRSGKVQGYASNGIHVFRGIPYGASTEGTARFLPSSAPQPWEGVRSTVISGYVSPQRISSTIESSIESFIFRPTVAVQSEDCLCLNLWTPGLDSQKRPVMVWIHGGDFTYGSGDAPQTDGENLSRRGDVVVVTVNHRLGAVGFLDLSAYGEQYASSGNVGMLDLVLALEWVKDNIANFGGDASSVTIFGQSGGGQKVSTLMYMPKAKGLFHKAIVESGALVRLNEVSDTQALTAEVLKRGGIKVADLQKLSFRQLVDLVEETTGKYPPRNRRLGPVVDGSIIPMQPYVAGAQELSTEIPLLMGTTLNEWKTGIGDSKIFDRTESQAKDALHAMYNDDADSVYSAFASLYKSERPGVILSMATVAEFRLRVLKQAGWRIDEKTAPVWLYRFDWKTPIYNGLPMAFHGSEIAFAFNNTDRCANMTGGGTRPQALANRVSDAWASFAWHGNPNHSGLPHWPQARKIQWQTMLFDDGCRMSDNPDGSAYERARKSLGF